MTRAAIHGLIISHFTRRVSTLRFSSGGCFTAERFALTPVTMAPRLNGWRACDMLASARSKCKRRATRSFSFCARFDERLLRKKSRASTSPHFLVKSRQKCVAYAEARVSTSIGFREVATSAHHTAPSDPRSLRPIGPASDPRRWFGKAPSVGGRQIRAKRRDGYPQRRHGHGRGGTCTPRSPFPGQFSSSHAHWHDVRASFRDPRASNGPRDPPRSVLSPIFRWRFPRLNEQT